MTIIAPIHNRSFAGGADARLTDGLRLWEHLFLLVVLVVSSYALSQQPQFQSLAWYLIYLTALVLFLLRYGPFIDALWIAAPLLLWPLLAGLSYFWSDAPEQSLRTTVQLGMTVLISVYLGARFSLFELARALFVVLALTGLLSLLSIMAQSGFAYDLNGVARGIFPHKNVLGGRMVLLLVCSLLFFAAGWHRLVASATAVVSITLVALSESGTAIVMALGLCGLAPVVLTRHAAAPLRLMAYLVALLAISVTAWSLFAFDLDPVGLVLEALGKERTLTGRSVLWDFATRIVEARPLLGSGFDAFWNGGDGSAGHYVQYALRQDIMNFHNSYLDIVVQLGLAGLLVMAVFLLLFAWRALVLLYRDHRALAGFPALFLAFVTIYSLSEYAVFRQHALIQVLLGAIYVSAALSLPQPRPSRRQASPANLPQM